MTPTRVKARTKGVRGYISAMRPFWLSNPFTKEQYPDIDDCLSTFEEYFRWVLENISTDRKRFDAIPENATIGCTCKEGSRCHVDIIIKIWKERHR